MRYAGLMDDRAKTIKENIDEIKELLKTTKNVVNINMEDFLQFCMNFTEMQMWLFEKKIKGHYFNQTDIYEKLFSLKTNEEIVRKYDEYVLKLEKQEDRVVIKKRYIKR